MKTGLLWRLLILLPGCLIFKQQALRSQNTIGIPPIINYPKQVYAAGSQNWNIAQDSSGIMYFANNDGLLSFDGSFWRLYPLPNKTIARSVAVGKDNRIYIGGQGEIGFFSPGETGELEYTSLNKLLPADENDFADVWNICFFNNRVFFRAIKKILEYDGQKIRVYRSESWGYLGLINGELIAREDRQGLVSYAQGQWRPRVRAGLFLSANITLRTVLPFGKDSMLLVTLMHGLFVLHHDTLSAFETADTKAIAEKNISAAAALQHGRIALITNLSGCYIISKEGGFIQRFTKQEGIQNNNVLSIMMDRDENLWLGLDNGIDLVTYGNAIKNIFPDKEDRNSGYTSFVRNNDLYLGVSTGAFRIRLDPSLKDISYAKGSFDFVDNSKGQVWSFSSVNGKLLMGHNKGAYIIEGSKSVPLDTKAGFWGFQPLFNSPLSSVIVAGTYNGINFYRYNQGQLEDPLAYSKVESARFIAIGKDMIWIAHPYKGIYRIAFDQSGPHEAARYKDVNNILSSNHNKVFQLGDRVVLTTDKGIFEYDEVRKDFIPSTWLRKLLGEGPVSYIKQDKAGNIWFCRDRKVGVVDHSPGTPRIVMIPEIDGRIMAGGFENINIIDSNNVLIAAERGFFHINYSFYKKSKPQLEVLIRKVESASKERGLVYGGYRKLISEPSLKYRHNALYFACSSTLFGQEQHISYSYFLEGFDESWSDWTLKTEKDYTNLPPGHYVFRVKCRNNTDNESSEASFGFSILPPWYRTWWAYTGYALAAVGLLYLFYKRQQRKYKRIQLAKLAEQQRKYDEEQKRLRLQHQLAIQESEKQIVELKNEKLQAEVEHKNSELASSAMNLVRKKEMLSKLKLNLEDYKLGAETDKTGKELQKIIRVIDKELDHNEEWEQFAIHFDSVHTNYLKKLKEYCPSLSVSDLKLAAYLRLNLSTKEIAQLMTISVRGVETSRYRLRKKLKIDQETNLVDFLISITS